MLCMERAELAGVCKHSSRFTGYLSSANILGIHGATHNHCTTAKVIYFVEQEKEIELGYALLMTANKPETVLYRASTSLLASNGGISLWE